MSSDVFVFAGDRQIRVLTIGPVLIFSDKVDGNVESHAKVHVIVDDRKCFLLRWRL